MLQELTWNGHASTQFLGSLSSACQECISWAFCMQNKASDRLFWPQPFSSCLIVSTESSAFIWNDDICNKQTKCDFNESKKVCIIIHILCLYNPHCKCMPYKWKWNVFTSLCHKSSKKTNSISKYKLVHTNTTEVCKDVKVQQSSQIMSKEQQRK